MSDPLFSLVMCIHGVEDYVYAAVTALLEQDFKDFELILIDDETADRSMLRALRAAGNDERVRIIHNKENLGLPASRNRGIDASRGRYIAFPDAEDTALPGYLSAAANAIKTTNSDVIVEGVTEDFFNRRGDISYSKRHIPESAHFPAMQTEGVGIFKDDDRPHVVQFLEKYDLMHHIYTKFFKRELIGETRFETKQHYSEDFFFTLEMLEKAQSICVLADTFYVYKRHLRRQKQLSLTKGTFIERHRRIAASQLHQEENNIDTLASRQFLGALYMRYIMAELARMQDPAADKTKEERQNWFAFLHEDPLFDLLVAQTSPDKHVTPRLYHALLTSGWKTGAFWVARAVAFLKSFGPGNYARTQE